MSDSINNIHDRLDHVEKTLTERLDKLEEMMLAQNKQLEANIEVEVPKEILIISL